MPPQLFTPAAGRYLAGDVKLAQRTRSRPLLTSHPGSDSIPTTTCVAVFEHVWIDPAGI